MLNNVRHFEATWILGFLFISLALLLNSLGQYEGCLIFESTLLLSCTIDRQREKAL